MKVSLKRMRPRTLALTAMLMVLASGAHFSAAADRDVKAPPTPMDVPALSRFIDHEIQKQLTAERRQASALADDAVFLRRVFRDITGVIPPAEKVQAFLDSKDADKRARVIDELLASPQYGHHMADIWQALLLP